MTRVSANLLLLACAAIWGFAFLFQKSAMTNLGPLTFVAARTVVAVLTLIPFALAEARRAGAPNRRFFLLAGGAAGAYFVAAALQQTGLQSEPVTATAFLTATYVVATPLISFAVTRVRIAPIVWVAVLLSIGGSWLLVGGSSDAFSIGDVLILASAFVWALQMVLCGLAAPFAQPVLFITAQFTGVAVAAVAAAIVFEPIWLAGLQASAIEILYTGAIAGALTHVILVMALRATTPSEAAIVLSTDTVFAAAAAALIFGETIEAAGWLGAALILVAIALVHRVIPWRNSKN